MRAISIHMLGVCLMLGACGQPSGGNASDASGAGGGAAASPSGDTGAAATTAAAAAPAARANCTDYRTDMSDGDMVRIYYGASGLTPPTEKWAESAMRSEGQGVSQEESWKRANDKVAAQWNAIKDVRCVTLRINADIRTYDDGLGAILVGGLRPDSFYSFSDGSDRVQLRIVNAEKAQVWKLPKEQATAWMANYGLSGAAAVLRARVLSARPSDSGGVIEAEVTSYDIVPTREGIPQQTVKVEE